MKKRILTILLLLSCTSININAIAQTKADNFKAKVAEKSNKIKGTSTTDLDNTSNQYEQAAFITEGNFKVYTTMWMGKRVSGSSSSCKDLKYEKKPWKMIVSDVEKENEMTTSFTTNRAGNALSTRSWTFTPTGTAKDENNHYTDATCWSTGKGSYVIVYNGGIYSVTNDPYPTNDYCIMSSFGSKVKLEELKAYTAPFVELRKESQKKASANAKKEQEAEHNKHTISNKDIAKIEVIASHDDKFGVWSSLKIGIEATLKDGSKIKTTNIGGDGYLLDYDINITGVQSDIVSGYQVSPQIHKLKGDYILVEVSAKHDKTIKTEKKVILNYNNSVKLYYQGMNGLTGDSAEPGKSLRVEAKGLKHSETGEDLVQYNIYNLDGDLINSVRVRPDRSFFISTKGGSGSNNTSESWNGGNGYHGKNGGSITFIIDTNLKNYTFDYETIGGNGGNGMNSYHARGRNGLDGNYTQKTQNVQW